MTEFIHPGAPYLEESTGELPNFLVESFFSLKIATRREFLDIIQKVLGVDSDHSIIPQIRANQKAARYWREQCEGSVREQKEAVVYATLQTERAATWKRDAEAAEAKLKQMTGGVAGGADECREFTAEEVTRDDSEQVSAEDQMRSLSTPGLVIQPKGAEARLFAAQAGIAAAITVSKEDTFSGNHLRDTLQEALQNVSAAVVLMQEKAEKPTVCENRDRKGKPSGESLVMLLRTAHCELQYPAEAARSQGDCMADENIRKVRRIIVEALNLCGYTHLGRAEDWAEESAAVKQKYDRIDQDLRQALALLNGARENVMGFHFCRDAQGRMVNKALLKLQNALDLMAVQA